MIENKLRLNIVIVLFTLLCPFMYVNVVAQNIPPSTTNLVLWLKADSGIVKFGATDSVQGWEDGAGTNEAAVQATAANMPRLINGGPLVNNKAVLAFDGNNDIMTGPILTGLGAGQYSIFILANGNNQTGNSSYGFFGMATGEGVFDIFRRSGTNENIRVLSTSGSLTSATGSFLNTGFPYRVISVTQNTGTNGARLRVNGTLSATNTLGAFADNIYTIGRANGTLMVILRKYLFIIPR